MKIVNGAKFGRWTVIDAGKERALCRCDCGTEKSIWNGNLTGHKSRSCGCLKNELSGSQSRTHGHTRSRGNNPHASLTYAAWSSMWQRCTNTKNDMHHRYGGRGITVCDSWKKFENFLSDMGEKPNNTSLDRIDNNKGYSKENCRWATPEVQANNKNNNVNIEYNGIVYRVQDLARTLDVSPTTISKWIKAKSGGTLERIMWQHIKLGETLRGFFPDWAKEIDG